MHRAQRLLSGRWLAGAAALWLLGVELPSAGAQDAVGRGAARPPVDVTARLSAERYFLDNGLEVILHPEPAQPRASVLLWYHVGPSSEPAGRSGFAHLFEHLMFEGSRHVGRDYDVLLESAGATNVNGTTSWDRTNYFATLPPEYLERLLWLESDRMGYMLDGITQQRLDVQRSVVLNERRQSYENAPYGPSSLALLDGLFPEGHPYHGAVIGSMTDLRAATLDDVRRFFEQYYAPSNATLAVGGHFDTQQVKRWIARYFGTLPARAASGAVAAPPALQPRRVGPTARCLERSATPWDASASDTVPPCTLTPPRVPSLRQSERLEVREPVQTSKVAVGWVTAPIYTEDDAPLRLVAAILGAGRSSRLHQALVVQRRLATETSASLDPTALGGIFCVDAMVAPGAPADSVERALQEQLAELAQHPPSAAELARAKRLLQIDALTSLQQLVGPEGESGSLGWLQSFAHYLGDPALAEHWLARLELVTPAQIQEVTERYLVNHPRMTVVTLPDGAAQ